LASTRRIARSIAASKASSRRPSLAALHAAAWQHGAEELVAAE
jgi:hypothetical protein